MLRLWEKLTDFPYAGSLPEVGPDLAARKAHGDRLSETYPSR